MVLVSPLTFSRMKPDRLFGRRLMNLFTAAADRWRRKNLPEVKRGLPSNFTVCAENGAFS